MQTRTITVDYARPRGYDVGYRAENNFTMLALPIPEELEGADSYRVYFESTVGEYLQTELLTPTDGYVTVKITSDIVPEPGNMAAQLVAFADGEIVGYAPMITGSAKVSIPDGTERLSHSLAAEIALNTSARHSHDNKAVLDKFAESDGQPTYDGQALGSGGSTGTELFVVDVQVESGEEYTITSHDKTYTQINEAYKAGKQILAVCTITGEDTVYLIPLIFATETDYTFSVFAGANFYIYVDSTDTWDISIDYLEASTIKAKLSDDASAKSSSLQYILNYMVYPAVEKAHEHSNETVLDHLSDSNGKLLYNGTEAGLKGERGDPGAKGADGKTPVKGTDYWTATDKQEIIDDIHPAYYIDLTGTYPNYTCPVTMDDIKAAYNSGYNLVCRCTLGVYTATLPLFIPMPSANTWIFSGSGCLQSMGFPAQSFTVAITGDGVAAQNKELTTSDGTLPNPYMLRIIVGNTPYVYDGSARVDVVIDDGTEVSY